MLALDRLKAVLDYDRETGFFRWKISKVGWRGKYIAFPGQLAGYKDRDGYWQIIIDGHSYPAHRLAWFYVKGVWPASRIDHHDGDKSNNQWVNLRPATASQNSANSRRSRTNKTGFKGVHLSGGVWKFTITSGMYATPEEAHEGYRRVAEFIHREFANTG